VVGLPLLVSNGIFAVLSHGAYQSSQVKGLEEAQQLSSQATGFVSAAALFSPVAVSTAR
jgi:predicted hydrolase (HD superfamily)